MASSSVVPSPSAFATLLRRSKFATYDPQIGQIYATYEGYAYRGDWGLKRPLGNRRRNGRIIVQSVDTIYQQTQWRSAFLDSSWMKKQEELSITPTLTETTQWVAPRVGQWTVDSDLAENDELREIISRNDAAPNPDAMTERQFKRYLEQVREHRAEFPSFLEKVDQAQASRAAEKKTSSKKGELKKAEGVFREYDAIGIARSLRAFDEYTDNDLRFIAEKQIVPKSSVRTAPVIKQFPHPNAGLSYAHAPALQNYYMAKPIPGRRLMIHGDKYSSSNQSKTANVSVAGWIATENYRGNKDVIDLGSVEAGIPRSNSRSGAAFFKVITEGLEKAPVTVGKYPKTLGAAKIRMVVSEWSKPAGNPYPPGSREYVAYETRNVPRVEPKRKEKGSVHAQNMLKFKRKPPPAPAAQGAAPLENMQSALQRVKTNRKQ